MKSPRSSSSRSTPSPATLPFDEVSASSTISYRVENIGPMYSIILGSPTSGQITDVYREQAIAICAAAFGSFTVTKSEGFFKGAREESLIFDVATQEPDKVLKLAAQLAEVFDQDGVGVVRPAGPGTSYIGYSRVIPNRPVTTI
jgi:hypothetical protein